ncbi:MAG: sulfite exporter TauE/SafE family protein [Ekhidna sp.]|nr:sulfite exporter TauE/SafE family protein [Ekhidna sp.]
MTGAFLIGLMGSLHCVGMCGPVMLAFNGANQKSGGFAVYHSGRILSYLMIGLVLGGVGSFILILKIQQIATLVLGAIILLLYGIPDFRNRIERLYYQSKFYHFIRAIISKNLSLKRRWFFSGAANGFFPCGLTYIAAAGAIVMSDFWQGALFMLFFGLGTIPALFILQFSGNFIVRRFKNLIPGSMYFVALLSGLLMIYRGTVMIFPDFDAKVREGAIGLMTVCGL